MGSHQFFENMFSKYYVPLSLNETKKAPSLFQAGGFGMQRGAL
jgi:hypothetical protein